MNMKLIAMLTKMIVGYIVFIVAAALVVFTAGVVALVADRLSLRRLRLKQSLDFVVGVLLIIAVLLAFWAHVWLVYIGLKVLF